METNQKIQGEPQWGWQRAQKPLEPQQPQRTTVSSDKNNDCQSKSEPSQLPPSSLSSPQGSSMVRVNVIRNEELSVLDDWICDDKFPSRVYKQKKKKSVN